MLSTTGSVFGTALDPQGRPIAGAAAKLVGSDAARETTADVHGAFRFLGIAPGLYRLELVQTGFEPARQEVTVLLGKSAVIEVTLQVAGAQEVITVVGQPPSLDSRKVETGATYEEQELASIPTTRDPWAILRQVPGVLLADMNVGDGRGSFVDGFVGKGSHGDQSTTSLDGVSLSFAGFSPFLFDFDSLESIGVATGGSDPSLSGPGVSLNLVTKRGTNQITGSARGLYTGGAQWDYGLEVGGPLWKDRLWIWGAGASNSFLGETESLPDGETVRSQESHTHWNAKLTAQLLPSNTLTFSYLRWERLVDGRGAGPQVSEPSTWDVTFPGESYKMEDSHVLSERLFGALYFSYVPVSREAVPKGGLETQADTDAESVLRYSNVHQFVQRTLRQSGLTASAFFDTGRLSHELKFGFGYRNMQWDSVSAWPGDQLVGFANLEPAQAAVTRAMNVRLLDQLLRHVPLGHDQHGQPHGESRRAVRLPAVPQPAFRGSRQ